jgi:hypothetical protein
MTWPLHICREYSTRLDRMFSFSHVKKFEWRWRPWRKWMWGPCSDMMNSFERCCFEHIWSCCTSTSSAWLFRSALIWSVPEALFQVLVSLARTHTRWIAPRINTLIRLDDKTIRCPFCKLALQALYSVDRSSLLHSVPVKFSVCPPPQFALQFFSVLHVQLVLPYQVQFFSVQQNVGVLCFTTAHFRRNHPFFEIPSGSYCSRSVSVLSSFYTTQGSVTAY